MWNLSLTSTVTSSIICIITLIILLYHLCSNENKKIDALIRYISILVIVCCSIASIATIITTATISKEFMPKNSLLEHIANTTTVIQLSAWLFGEFFLYLLLLQRLKQTYYDSAFRVSNLTYMSLVLILIIFLLIQICRLILLAEFYFKFIPDSDINLNNYGDSTFTLLIAATIIHLVVAVMLLYMFLHRLLKLFIMVSYNNIRQYSGYGIKKPNYPELHALNEEQKSMLNLITKYCVLSVVTIISGQIYFGTSLIHSQAIKTSPNRDRFYIISYGIRRVIFAIDCVVNCICVLLLFSFQSKLYRILCGGCDLLCQSICTKYVQKRIKKEYRKMHEKLIFNDGTKDNDAVIELSISKSNHKSNSKNRNNSKYRSQTRNTTFNAEIINENHSLL
eukprot:266331_1